MYSVPFQKRTISSSILTAKCYFLIYSYFVFTLWIKKIEPDELIDARNRSEENIKNEQQPWKGPGDTLNKQNL